MLAEDLAEFYDDPIGYVEWAFPWGQAGTILAKFKGLRPWQKEFLLDVAKLVIARDFNGFDPVEPIQMSRASGHGIGKSALVAMIIKWIMDTRPFAKGVVTANTGEQLKTKTWGELGKWHNMSITKELFVYNNTKGNMCFYNTKHKDTWRCDAMTCREENSEAFAGLHAATSTPFYIFDEASAVPEKIFEVAQGGLTDGEPMWFLFGNPTRNTGFFRQTFGRLKHRWQGKQIDSRDVEGTNTKLMNSWIEDYGIDSDFVRVRVRGIFPRLSVSQLISGELVTAAMGKHLQRHVYSFAPRILGLDVAWEGDDRNSLWLRQGMASWLLWQGRETDSIDLAGIVAQFEDKYQTHATFIDAGMGNGVIDQLRRLGRNPTPIYFGGKSGDPSCLNKRAEMWVKIRDWLGLGGALPDDPDVYEDLTGVEKHHTREKGLIQLESKKDMKGRGLASPDLGDGLALTFAQDVAVPDPLDKYRNINKDKRVESHYDVFEDQSNGNEQIKKDYDVFAEAA